MDPPGLVVQALVSGGCTRTIALKLWCASFRRYGKEMVSSSSPSPHPSS